MIGEVTFDSRGKHPAACLLLQVLAAADMIRIGVGAVNCIQNPALSLQKLTKLPSGILVVSAVNGDDMEAVAGAGFTDVLLKPLTFEKLKMLFAK